MSQELLRIPADDVHIEGLLELPAGARGLVLFAHGSGSSRHSPRNGLVARVLQAQGTGTLLLDLLTLCEDLDYHVPAPVRRPRCRLPRPWVRRCRPSCRAAAGPIWLVHTT